MVIDAPLTITLYRIATFTKDNTKKIRESMISLASGQKINNPSDSIGEYFRSKTLKENSETNRAILKKIEEGKAFLSVASSVGEKIFRFIYDMRDMVKNYYKNGITQDNKDILKKDFEALKMAVTDAISESVYDDKFLISDNNGNPFLSIALDVDKKDLKIDIIFTEDDIPNVSSLTIGEKDMNTEINAIEQQLNRAGSYLSKVSAYTYSLDSFYNIISKQIQTEIDTSKQIVDSDYGFEMVELIKRSIRNEISMAMFSQGNLSRSFVLKLVGM